MGCGYGIGLIIVSRQKLRLFLGVLPRPPGFPYSETHPFILRLFPTVPGPSNVVPFWVWYGFLVRILIRTTKKVLHWRV